MAISPNLLNDLLLELLGCACSALEDGVCPGEPADCGCPCRQYIAIGPVAWDNCCDDGQLSVSVDRIYPVNNFPQQASGANLCQTPLAADIVVTLLRCYPVTDDNGDPPTHTQLERAGESLNRDLYILTKGLLCCLSVKKRKQQFMFMDSRFVGPNGGCAGVELRFAIGLWDPLP